MLQQRQPKWQEKVNDWIEEFDWADKFTLKDDTDSVHGDAWRGFYVLGPAATSAIPILSQMLNDSNTAVLAVAALGAIGPESAPLLFAASTNTDEEVRSSAITALAGLEEKVPGLAERMLLLRTDTNEDVATTAIYWLVKKGWHRTE